MRAGIASGLGALLYVGLMTVSCAEKEGTEGEKRKANRLIHSKSPYLLQHAYNPVDWYPWGEEAFEKARAEGKPILLSVGYSTCHWCHVMERESFEDEGVAAFLNKHFVAIKLDREERPDVDRVYMTTYQAMFQDGGGWPLNMFLTPELKPFYGGTYFPPADRGGRPGFLNVLTQLEKAWREKKDDVTGTANDIHQKLAAVIADSHKLKAGKEKITPEVVEKAVKSFLTGADKVNGGWGRQQKFPQPSHLRFLLRAGGKEERDFALFTCRKMIEGGIHDHIGGGIHRYTVDPVWLVPHFEKMLYDQAQVLDVFVDAWLLTKDETYRKAAVGIAEYVLDQLTHKDGGFFSAQDAQSEGKEGKYWCWTEAELKTLLAEAEFKAAQRWFGFTAKGNFLDHSDPEPLADQNVLFLADPKGEWNEGDKKALASALEKMTAARSKRVPPATDDKILASWNGLMISAMARAGRFLGETRYLEAAEKAHGFLVAKLWDEKSKTLSHRWRDDDVDKSQQAESYIYLMRGSRTLYEATLDPKYLTFAVALAGKAKTLFYDEENGGFFDGEKRADLVIRMKGDYDSATPTSGSVAIGEYAALAEITGREDFRAIAEKSLQAALPTLEQTPTSLAESLIALDFFASKPARLVIAGGESKEDFLKVAWGGYRRNLLVMGNTGPVDEFTAGLKAVEGKTTAYYCVGQTCRLPETNAKKVESWLNEDPGGEGGAQNPEPGAQKEEEKKEPTP